MRHTIRQWLIEIRNSKDMTHEAVAAGSGIQRAYYTQIENGTRTPSVSIAKRIAECLGFDWTVFFDQDCSVTRQYEEREFPHEEKPFNS